MDTIEILLVAAVFLSICGLCLWQTCRIADLERTLHIEQMDNSSLRDMHFQTQAELHRIRTALSDPTAIRSNPGAVRAAIAKLGAPGQRSPYAGPAPGQAMPDDEDETPADVIRGALRTDYRGTTDQRWFDSANGAKRDDLGNWVSPIFPPLETYLRNAGNATSERCMHTGDHTCGCICREACVRGRRD